MSLVPWWKINIKKENLLKINEAFRLRLLSEGSVTKKLEEKIKKTLRVKHVVSTTSGTSAILLLLIYFSKKFPNKKEVIISNRSWISPAHAAHSLNLKLSLVDTKKNYPLANEEEIVKKINKNTLVIFCIQLNGKSLDINLIKKSSKYKKFKPFIIEDSAQSFFSKYNGKYIGTVADAGILSFSMGKIVSSGQGGVILTNSNKIQQKIRLIKNNGIVDRYTDKWNTFGLNFKFTDIQASMLLNQIDNIKSTAKKLQSLYKFYETNLKNIKALSLVYSSKEINKGWVPLYIECCSNKRKKIITLLKENKIQVRKIYPSLDSTKYLNIKNKKFKNSKNFNKKLFYLPSGPDQDKSKLKRMFKLLSNI